MIAHVVLDLPLENHFDYLVPHRLEALVVPGMRVKVVFGTKLQLGFVIAIADRTDIPRIKPIKSIVGDKPIFDARDLAFAKDFATYYGCSLGEALTTFLRHHKDGPIPSRSKGRGQAMLYHCLDGNYAPTIAGLTQGREDYAIIVPDAAVANGLSLPVVQRPFVGLRSSMFQAFARANLIIVVDEENASYKQEQSPMYESRQVLLAAQKIYGFDLAFVGITPSVELMHDVATKRVALQTIQGIPVPKVVVIDLSNYRFLDKRIIAPPVRNALESNIKSKKRSLIVFNRKGQDATHMQKELAVLFPMGRIATFDKNAKELPAHFDICITTQAILRFKHRLKVETIIFVDLDSELHWADIRSSFKAWALVAHMRLMGQNVLVQTRNPKHHVVRALSQDDPQLLYAEELRLREELRLAPFNHWVTLIIRGKLEKSTLDFARDVYNKLSETKPKGIALTAVEPDVPPVLRAQYRFKLVAQGENVPSMVQLFKETLASFKRKPKVLATLNIDP